MSMGEWFLEALDLFSADEIVGFIQLTAAPIGDLCIRWRSISIPAEKILKEVHKLAARINENRKAVSPAREARKQRVYILPGILGSKLSRKLQQRRDLIWFDPTDIPIGGIAKLKYGDDATKIIASGVFQTTYLRMKLQLMLAGYDARYLPFDWRHPTDVIGRKLHKKIRKNGKKDVILVCHSMGGLVARQIAGFERW